MAEENTYDDKTMCIAVMGGKAEKFVKDKLCEQGLKVIEVYAGWAGRCNSVLPLLKRLKTEKDYEETCFVMLHCQAESHELLAEYVNLSIPHFLFYRNGVLKATVKGANTPEFERLVVELTPVTADTDDLDENPMYVRRKEDLDAQAEGA